MNPRERKTHLKEKLLTSACTQEELRELYYLVEKYGSREEADQLMEKLWETDAISHPLEKKKAEQLLDTIQHRTSLAYLNRERRYSIRKYYRVAASLVLFISAGLLIYHFQSLSEEEEIQYMTRSTQKGQRASFRLSDGSTVMLNAGSSLSYPKVFDDSTRRVSLVGEAFFEVVPNPDKPFLVAISGLETRVLGTSFNIRAFDEQPIEVTVATGKVQVAMQQALRRKHLQDSAVILTPMNQLAFDPQDSSVQVREVDLRPYLAWKENTLYFEMETFANVLQSLERWYNVKITVADGSVSDCRIKANYHDESLENVLKGLQLLVDFEYSFTDATHIRINGNQCKN